MARRGRPPKKAGTAKTAPLGVRVQPTLKEALEASAKETGHSLSEEINFRLWLSFVERQRTRDRFGGATNFHLFEVFADAIKNIEKKGGGERWFADRFTYEATKEMIAEVLNRIAPRGRLAAKRKESAKQLGKKEALMALYFLESAFQGLQWNAGIMAASGPLGTKIKNSATKDILALEPELKEIDEFLREGSFIPDRTMSVEEATRYLQNALDAWRKSKKEISSLAASVGAAARS